MSPVVNDESATSLPLEPVTDSVAFGSGNRGPWEDFGQLRIRLDANSKFKTQIEQTCGTVTITVNLYGLSGLVGGLDDIAKGDEGQVDINNIGSLEASCFRNTKDIGKSSFRFLTGRTRRIDAV